MARGNGAVVVSSVESLQNLLGLSPEWFEPMPAVTGCTEGSFLGLEVGATSCAEIRGMEIEIG